jgi:hypothetical protein
MFTGISEAIDPRLGIYPHPQLQATSFSFSCRECSRAASGPGTQVSGNAQIGS